jgi:hypothetical protein
MASFTNVHVCFQALMATTTFHGAAHLVPFPLLSFSIETAAQILSMLEVCVNPFFAYSHGSRENSGYIDSKIQPKPTPRTLPPHFRLERDRSQTTLGASPVQYTQERAALNSMFD